METNGISLNSNREEKTDRSSGARSLIIGVVAGLGLAAALGGAFMLGGRGADEGSAAQSGIVEEVAGSDDAGGATDGAQGNSGGVDDQGAGVSEEPVDEPEQPAQDPTATPTETATNTPSATPTETPEPECAFCPEGLDLQAEEPVVPPCGEDCVIDGGIIVELPELAFEEAFVNVCDGFVAMKAEIQGNAEMWVTYSKEWQVTIESEHQFGESFFLGETGEWIWFGDWGWLYPIDIVFHAEDAEGHHIEKEIHQLDYVC